ncbi:MAG: c-type cytochrome [Chlorogloea purpurea SAG 13.99]|nr:c-type cytochrome [Chlorogloea purpurea SAG 13.99]
MLQKFFSFFFIILIASGIYINPAFAADISNGDRLFTIHCAGCHPGGGNIIRRGKNLKLKALHKNKIDSLEAVISITTNGKNNMSAFAQKLTSQEIEDISAYVLERAAKDWRNS